MRRVISPSEKSWGTFFMISDIDKYFAKFSNLPDPTELRKKRSGVRAVMIGHPGAITSITPMPEDAAQYAYIGKIAVEWAILEARIDAQIWNLCGAPQRLTACLTAQMIGPNPRLQALISLCAEKGFPRTLIEDLSEFKKFARGVGEQRNCIVHDSWHMQFNELTGERIYKNTVTAKSSLTMEREEVTLDQLERTIFKIRKLIDIFELHICSAILRETRFKNI